MKYIFKEGVFADKVNTHTSEERYALRVHLKKKGDVIIYPLNVYNRIRRLVQEENRDAKIKGLVPFNKVLFSIKKKDNNVEVVRNA